MNTINKITEYYHNQLANMKHTETLRLWIAKDKKGQVFLHHEKPYCIDGCWCNKKDQYNYLHSIDFPSLTFENSPQQVELKLIEDVKNI